MKLATLSLLRLEIDPDRYLQAAASKSGLWYLMDRLFSGEEIAEAELLTWGIKIRLEDEFIAVPRAE